MDVASQSAAPVTLVDVVELCEARTSSADLKHHPQLSMVVADTFPPCEVLGQGDGLRVRQVVQHHRVIVQLDQPLVVAGFDRPQ